MLRAPEYPESHNLNGLIYEAHLDYEAAIHSYELAREAINISCSTFSKSYLGDVSNNLARSLAMVNLFSCFF